MRRPGNSHFLDTAPDDDMFTIASPESPSREGMGRQFTLFIIVSPESPFREGIRNRQFTLSRHSIKDDAFTIALLKSPIKEAIGREPIREGRKGASPRVRLGKVLEIGNLHFLDTV